VSEAIFGLVGVVIGGLLNAVGLWVIEYRRDRRVAQVAARLLIPDLNQVRHAMKIGLEGKTWSHVHVPGNRWREYEGALARAMKPKDWSLVAGVFLALEMLGNELAVLEGHGDLGEPLGTVDLRQIRAIYDLAGEALGLLGAYGNAPPPPPELEIDPALL
jgi:hypothetical protein